MQTFKQIKKKWKYKICYQKAIICTVLYRITIFFLFFFCFFHSCYSFSFIFIISVLSYLGIFLKSAFLLVGFGVNQISRSFSTPSKKCGWLIFSFSAILIAIRMCICAINISLYHLLFCMLLSILLQKIEKLIFNFFLKIIRLGLIYLESW